MRKLIFDKIARVMMVALMATVCMTFMTACGGSDDDPLDNPNPVNNNTNNGGDNNNGNNGASADVSAVRYFVPCTEWGYTRQQVDAWMDKVDWMMLSFEDNNVAGENYTNIWEWKGRKVEVYYEYETGADRLKSVIEWYYLKSEAEVQYVVSETEKAFGVKLVQTQVAGELSNLTIYRTADGSGQDIEINYNRSFECYIGINRKK